jgi:glyoxylase-like metal-dependent hydrolase (beta-lactamase superfamily II)
VLPLGSGTHLIDTGMSGYGGITAAYAILADRPCLVETGTATSAATVIAALAELGVGPDDLEYLVVTHIHLDHAGGVGDLAAAFPRAKVVVHERGARHLADPERLMNSARMVFGSVLDEVFGPLAATDANRIMTIGDSGEIDLGSGRTLQAFHSPGHASHHLGLIDSATGDLFVGDAAGIHVPETGELLPGTPPPEFDLDQAVTSLRLFRERQPQRLLFSHFGPVTEPTETLLRAEEEIRVWVDAVRDSRSAGLDLDHAVEMVRAKVAERAPLLRADPRVSEKFQHLNADRTNVVGISRWLDAQSAEPG